jgi:hypothetical protein
MPNCHRLLLLSPWPAQEDIERATSILHFPVSTTDGRQFTISLLGQPHVVYCICVTIPNSDGQLSVEDLARISKINSRMLAALRLTYDPNTDVVYTGDDYLNALFVNEEEFPKSLPIHWGPHFNPDFRVNVENIKSMFKSDYQVPGLMPLLGEVGLSSLPIQYKFLASYKVLDLASGGQKGFSPVVQGLIDKRDPQFQQLHLSARKFRNFIHEYRDKCAHIYTGNDPALGIVGLASADAECVHKVMPLMRETMIEAVHTCFPNLGLTLLTDPT